MKSGAKWLKPYDAPLTALAFGLVALYAAFAGAGFPLDDSWIHQTYARNLAQTGVWSFVPGVPSAASTSPLYTVLLALGYALRVNYVLWTHALGAVALAASGMIAARLGDKISTGWTYTGGLTGAAVVLAWHLIWAAASGMETLLFACFTLALILAAWRELDAAQNTRAVGRGLVFGVLAALATSTRPEGVLLAGILGAAMLIARPQNDSRALIGWCGGAAAGFALCIAPYLLLNLHLTGGLLPNTSAAKQAEYAPVLAAQSFPLLMLSFFGAVIVGGQALLLPGMVVYTAAQIRRLQTDRRALLYLAPLMWAVTLIALYAARLPMYSQHGRYVIPALPSLIVIGVGGTAMLMRAARRQRLRRTLSLVLAASTVILFACFAFLIGPATLRQDIGVIDRNMVTAAHWLAENLPPENGLLALHDIGAVGYFAPRPLVDTAGLITPEVVPLLRDPDALWAFLEARGAAYFLGLPDQVPGGDVTDPRLCLVYTVPDTRLDQPAMALYALNWDGRCPD